MFYNGNEQEDISMKNSFLEIRDVVKYYGRGSVVTKALDGVSFTMERGEFTAIMGASGSGKSTLLNVISTIDTISSGEIILDGIRVADQKEEQLSAFRRDKLGFVFQEYNLLDTLTVGENIMLPLNLQKINACRKQSRACAAWRGSLTSKISSINFRMSFPADSGSVLPAQGQSLLLRQLFWRMNPPARWIRKILAF